MSGWEPVSSGPAAAPAVADDVGASALGGRVLQVSDRGAAGSVPAAALLAARSADAKLGEATVVMAMGDLLAVTDAFVVTSAGNGRQVKAIVEDIEAQLKCHMGRAPLRIEGMSDFQWVLMDYGDMVVHVFLHETRQLYDLERLWGDAPRVRWNEMVVDAP